MRGSGPSTVRRTSTNRSSARTEATLVGIGGSGRNSAMNGLFAAQ